jgi:putative ABC transport system permease protein
MQTLWQDIRYGLRMMRKDVAFSIIAILTLALGIGANTSIFSLVNTVLLRPLPYKDADHLVRVWSYNHALGDDTDLVSPLDFQDWRAQNHVFESMGSSTDVNYTLTGAGEPSLLIAYAFSADYFRVLGVAPLMGRTFLDEEEQPGKNHVAVLSYALWQNRFGSDRDVLNKSITLDGELYTVIGVMPREFQYPQRTELWTPLTMVPEAVNDRSYRYLRIVARLKPGVTVTQAQTEMNGIAERLATEYPKTNNEDRATNVTSLRQSINGDIRPALLVLLCAVGFVLLIACANVANLLLARAANRQKEVAVRSALGADRVRLVRQFLTESLLLGFAGGVLGLLLASWCTSALVQMFPPTIFNLDIPHVERIPIDGWVLGFAFFVSLFTSVTFGLAPALQACSAANETLKESGRGLVAGAQGRRFRDALVVAEIALSLILLTAAGLTLRTFLHLLQGNLGFRADHVVTMRVLPPTNKYKSDAQRISFSDQALERIQALPGVKAAGTVTFLPLSGWEGRRTVSLKGASTPENHRPSAMWSSVTPGYFQAMVIPLLKGRTIDSRDGSEALHVALLSKSLAERLSPNADPVGRKLDVDGIEGPVEIVGVVGDVHQLGITSDATSELYLSFAQFPAPILCFTVRTAQDPYALAKSLQQAVWSVDKDQAVAFVMTMDELASESLAPQRVIMLLLSAFGAVALLMATIGVYGVMANSVARRTQEFGIRVALGARTADVLRLVLKQGLGLVLAGIVIGLAGAFALMRFLASLLYGVRPLDPLTLTVAVASMTIVALLASYIPARRATRVDPMVALRYE